MKRKLAFILYLLYRYYDKGATRTIAYESAIMAMSFLIFLNLATLSIYFSVHKDLYSLVNSNDGYIKIIKGSLLLIPQILILGFVFKKDYLRNLKFNQSIVKLGNVLLILYIIASFIIVSLFATRDVIF
ncbi:MAG: hypothetical protein FD155_3489 [Bacteroidetes bacterium]|nr:MAG: hypothetical protein FD155_3489 [Bacteroidota bacterium]